MGLTVQMQCDKSKPVVNQGAIELLTRERNPIFFDLVWKRTCPPHSIVSSQFRGAITPPPPHNESFPFTAAGRQSVSLAGPLARCQPGQPGKHCPPAYPPPIEFSAPNYELKTDRGEKPIAVSHIRRLPPTCLCTIHSVPVKYFSALQNNGARFCESHANIYSHYQKCEVVKEHRNSRRALTTLFCNPLSTQLWDSPILGLCHEI